MVNLQQVFTSTLSASLYNDCGGSWRGGSDHSSHRGHVCDDYEPAFWLSFSEINFTTALIFLHDYYDVGEDGDGGALTTWKGHQNVRDYYIYIDSHLSNDVDDVDVDRSRGHRYWSDANGGFK